MEATTTLQEVILVEHFQPDLPLSILDFADWAREFSEFGEPTQLPWLPPIDLAQPSPFGFAFARGQDLPRLLLRSLDGRRHIQLQADRFAYGWTRGLPVGETDAYPGYDALRDTQRGYADKFGAWCVKKFGFAPKVRLVELTYNNATPLIVGGERRRLGEIFRWVQPIRPVNAFQVSWVEILDKGRLDGPRVNGLVAIGAAPPVAEVLLFNFTGLAPIENRGPLSTSEAWDALHGRIADIYQSTIADSGSLG